MVITHLGGQSFKVQFGDITLAFNPVSKDSKKWKPSKFGADVALITTNHPDMNGTDQVSFGEKKAFAISGPGEYEVKDVFIKGFKSESKYGGEDRVNTIYSVSLENMNLCFLGALSKEVPNETMESIDDVDILFVPIGGTGVLSGAEAAKVAVKIGPKLVIPMHYDAATLKTFLKESGEESVKPVDKLTLKKKDLEGKEGDVVVLEPLA
jgi:L-ascorbate metabolism protein UlaG (beta-lactamase superfamily)